MGKSWSKALRGKALGFEIKGHALGCRARCIRAGMTAHLDIGKMALQTWVLKIVRVEGLYHFFHHPLGEIDLTRVQTDTVKNYNKQA